MLDLKLIREQPDAVQRGLVTRGGAELDPQSFEVSKYCGPRARALINNVRSDTPLSA
jgi:seryl-tRNA synthetase